METEHGVHESSTADEIAYHRAQSVWYVSWTYPNEENKQ
jgi:hypothetical protein